MPRSSRRIWPQLTVEQGLWREGFQRVAGVDEVGIGPLAGPVVAAAVVFSSVEKDDRTALPSGVRDSKTLTPKAREQLDHALRQTALAVGVGVVDVEEIDRLNIYQAGLRAMRLAVAHLSIDPDQVLVDGRTIPNLPYPQQSVVKGDRDIYSIAAASIVAKVYRDRVMVELDARYPGYSFARHKGYGTALHRDALRRLGPCPAHRRSFRLL